jgi:hypothetical protein
LLLPFGRSIIYKVATLICMRPVCVAAIFLSFFLGLNEVANAQFWASTAPAGSGDVSFAGLGVGSAIPVAADIAGATARPVPALAPPLALPRMSPELALDSYEQRATRQAAELASYSATMVIRAELPESSQHGEFELERHYSAPRSLAFRVVQFTGDAFVKSNVITRLLQSEVDHVQKDDPALTAISTANYKFSYKATPMIQGRMMHVYQVKPRKKRVGLFKGRVYLDAYTGSLLYATGTLVKSPSFFIKKIEFMQEYADFGPFTFPVHMHTEANTRLIGRAIVDVEQRDYHPLALNVQSANKSSVSP